MQPFEISGISFMPELWKPELNLEKLYGKRYRENRKRRE